MHTALPEVAIQRTPIAVFVKQLAKIPQVSPQMLGRDRRIFPPFPSVWHTGDDGGGAEPGFANLPDLLLLLEVVIELHGGWMVLLLESLHQLVGMGISVLFRLSAEFDQQPAAARRQHRKVFRVQALLLHISHQAVIDALKPDRARLQNLWDMIARLVHVGIPEDQERARRRAMHESHGGLQYRDAGPLTADQRPRDVKAVL